MKSNVESRLKNYEQNLAKFEARWNQLKPNDAAMDEDPGAGDKAVQLIKEKKEEFAELEATREALEYVLLEFLCCVLAVYFLRCLLRVCRFMLFTGGTGGRPCPINVSLPYPPLDNI